MRRLDRMPTRKPKHLIPAAASAACLVTILTGCFGMPHATGLTPTATVTTAPAGPAPATSGPVTSAPASSDPPASAATAPSFTVTGENPVLPNGSQDTNDQATGAVCDKTKFSADRTLGADIAAGFALDGFSAASALLTHFLAGTGTKIAYPADSAISRQARASSVFETMNRAVQQAILGQLSGGPGRTRVQLSAAQLPTVAFESESSDLYWGFRGTQGLTVTGHGSLVNGRWTGTLTYVIRDSYGFPVSDALAGFGPPMRYLQTVCGAPQHPGGARWFPDSIAVTVPFSRPA
ncbi:MAG TPA: hypothetical protein VMI73_14585 [Trebonia sp.]|nr:hypothetical protein [Trebonia sp.]